jgi:phospholipid/cholesterol/gamma-HCH transport system substrate-binding protein
LIGDTSIDLIPLAELPAELEASRIEPLSKECESNLVICHNDRLSGENAPDIFASMIQLAETYTDPKFVDNLNNATKNASVAASKIARLTDDSSIALKSFQRDISTVTKNFSTISESATQTATDASRLLTNTDRLVAANQTQITRTVDETSELVSNLNLLIGANRNKIVQTVDRISLASSELNRLAANLNTTVSTVNQTLETADTQAIVQNLQTFTANAVEVSTDLRDLSNRLNDPTVLVTLQQTLDSARVTFANTQKLTSDLDELLGDPKLRENIRILIDGLSNLVSSTEHLEEQIRIAQTLELAQQNLAQSSTNRLDLSDFQPNRPYILPSHSKLILEKGNDAQNVDSVNK